ncbi:MAG: nitroreductase family protein [Collinsella sp.]
METIEALIHRRSCRKYSDRPVEAEKLARIIEAGQYAPSGMGRQPVTFVAVTDPATVERLSQLNAQVMGSEEILLRRRTVVVVLVDRAAHVPATSLAITAHAAYALVSIVLDPPRARSLITRGLELPPVGSARRRKPARCGQPFWAAETP